jgi:hypothetical protein
MLRFQELPLVPACVRRAASATPEHPQKRSLSPARSSYSPDPVSTRPNVLRSRRHGSQKVAQRLAASRRRARRCEPPTRGHLPARWEARYQPVRPAALAPARLCFARSTTYTSSHQAGAIPRRPTCPQFPRLTEGVHPKGLSPFCLRSSRCCSYPRYQQTAQGKSHQRCRWHLNSARRQGHEGFKLVIELLGRSRQRRVVVDRDER